MKLATFINSNHHTVIGVVNIENQTELDLQACYVAKHNKENQAFKTMLNLIDAGKEALAEAQVLDDLFKGDNRYNHHLKNIQLLSPVPEPRQIRDFNNAEGHWRNAPAGMEMLRARLSNKPIPNRSDISVAIPEVNYTQPIFYISNRFNVIGQDATVTWPKYSNWFDYEGEFGIYIAKKGKDISQAQAKDYIFGYSIFNDFSARDKQMREMEGRMGPTKGKSFDTGNSIGPWIVTSDEIDNPQNLKVTVRVNHEVWGESSTSTMVHSFEKIIEYISESETIHPGEFLGSGTIAGCCSLECDKWMKDGDIIEIEFEKLGILRNKVSREK